MLQNLLDQTTEMVANDETLNELEQPVPSAPPSPVVDEAVEQLMNPTSGGEEVVEVDTAILETPENGVEVDEAVEVWPPPKGFDENGEVIM